MCFTLYPQYFSHVTASLNIIVTCCILAFILSAACLFTEEHGNTPAELTSQLMQNPQILADLQHRLGSMVGVSSGYIQRFVYRCLSNLNAVYEEIFTLFYFRSHGYWGIFIVGEIDSSFCNLCVDYVVLSNLK